MKKHYQLIIVFVLVLLTNDIICQEEKSMGSYLSTAKFVYDEVAIYDNEEEEVYPFISIITVESIESKNKYLVTVKWYELTYKGEITEKNQDYLVKLFDVNKQDGEYTYIDIKEYNYDGVRPVKIMSSMDFESAIIAQRFESSTAKPVIQISGYSPTGLDSRDVVFYDGYNLAFGHHLPNYGME